MGSSAKIGNFFYWSITGALFWIKNMKVPFGIGHPPHLHIKPSLYVCRRVQGSQIFKQNWIVSIHSRIIVILLIWVSLALGGGGAGEWGCLGWSTIVYMSSGVFRGKESSNRIELSRLVQDLLNLLFWAPCSSGEGAGGWGWVGASGGMGGVPTCMHMHAHAHTHTYIHV